MTDLIELNAEVQADIEKLGKDKNMAGSVADRLALIELRRIRKAMEKLAEVTSE